MRLPPLLLVFAAAAATFGVSQAVPPTAHAQDLTPAPVACRAAVKSLRLTRTPHGLEVTGQIVNTGTQPLVYTAVMLVCRAADGAETAPQPAYLTAGPVRPGQSAVFRAVLPPAPADVSSAEIFVRLREAGQAVAVEQMRRS